MASNNISSLIELLCAGTGFRLIVVKYILSTIRSGDIGR